MSAAPEHSSDAEAPGRMDRVKAAAAALARAGARVVTTTILWSAGGALTSLGLLGVFLALGLLDHPAPGWSVLRLSLFVVLPLVSALLCGVVGFTRGLGAVALRVAVGEGALPALLLSSLDRAVEGARRSEGLDRSAALVEGALAHLPLARVEQAVRRAVGEAADEGELKGGLLARAGRRAITRPAEAILLTSLRAEARAGGGLDLARVRERALAAADEAFSGLIWGVVRKKTALWLSVLGLLHALPPTFAALLRGGWDLLA